MHAAQPYEMPCVLYNHSVVLYNLDVLLVNHTVLLLALGARSMNRILPVLSDEVKAYMYRMLQNGTVQTGLSQANYTTAEQFLSHCKIF